MTKIETIRNEVSDILKANFPEFEYKGHGANIGVWETEDFQSISRGSRSRLRCFLSPYMSGKPLLRAI